MAKTNVGIVDCAVYENGSNYLGIANITLPTLTAKTLTVTGLGVAGDVDFAVPGHKSAMRVTIAFRDAPEDSRRIVAHGQHILDCRVARENYDGTNGKYIITSHKYILKVAPLTETLGTVAPASQQGASDEFACLSYEEYIDDRLVRRYDPINNVDIDYNGNDILADVRSALGQ